jgi:predicted NAD/FAD-dependent oxidoreductase
MSAVRSVAVVGAGVSGSMCAHQLASSGFRVTVFDKSRGPGGRAATRRLETYRFDHGAQYFTVRDPSFQRLVRRWLDDGTIAPWPKSLVSLRHGLSTALESEERCVGVPGMSALAADLLRDVASEFAAKVVQLDRRPDEWSLTMQDGREAGPFDVVVVSAPPVQSAVLAGGVAPVSELARSVSMVPCWAVVLGFDSPVNLPFDAAFVEDNPLSWLARDSSKPGRSSDLDVWVLHGSSRWSQAHLEDSPEFVGGALHDAFEQATGRAGLSPHILLSHRWRYARPERSMEVGPSFYDPGVGIGLCGDWLSGGRIESAALSGGHLAERIIREGMP